MLHGLQAWGYHLANVVLHGLVCILYYKTCLAFAHSSKVAAICAYLFAVHPIHTEAVTGVVGRAELLSSVFFLLTILSYRKSVKKWPYLLLAMVFVACAMLCKEQGITVLGILVIYELFLVQKLDLGSWFHTRKKPANNNEVRHFYKSILEASTFVYTFDDVIGPAAQLLARKLKCRNSKLFKIVE
jgi:dolichyl-phosphate-mannose--protein O-mannosyl transferase